MKDVARAAGVSLMTVSYALRRDPRVAKKTAERVLEIAASMNYSPHPLVSALVTDIRSRRVIKAPPVIAFISSHVQQDEWWDNHAVQRAYYEGAKARCKELGFGFEHFNIAASTYSQRRLSDILSYRRVCGLLCAPVPNPGMTLDIDWERFPAVAFGYSMPEPPIHRFTVNHFQAMELALTHLRALGYQKIGVTYVDELSQRIGGILLAALGRFQQEIPVSLRVPVFSGSIDAGDPKAIKAWIRKYKPSVVLDTASLIHKELLGRAGITIPDEVAYATMSWHEGIPGLAGVNQNSYQIGVAAVDGLVSQIYNNQRGIPPLQTFSMVNGSWIDGPSAPLVKKRTAVCRR